MQRSEVAGTEFSFVKARAGRQRLAESALVAILVALFRVALRPGYWGVWSGFIRSINRIND